MTFNVFGVSEAALEKEPWSPSHLCLVILPAALDTDVISQFTPANRRLPTKHFGREAQHLAGQDKKRGSDDY